MAVPEELLEVGEDELLDCVGVALDAVVVPGGVLDAKLLEAGLEAELELAEDLDWWER